MSEEMTTQWLKSGEYLPSFMRDFHDQKDVFRAIDEVVQRRNEKDGSHSYTAGIGAVEAHVYTVDCFLWMMARHGYTLQRSRKRVEFSDLYEWLTGAKARRDRHMASLLGLTPIAPVSGQAGTTEQQGQVPGRNT